MPPVTQLRGVGPGIAQKLQRLNITQVEDLLFHLPLRYQDRTRIVPIGSLRPGIEALIEGEIQHTELVFRRRRMLLISIHDGTAMLLLRFFHFSAAQQQQLGKGTTLRCFGEVRRGPNTLEIVHPEYSILHANQSHELEQTLTPVYPTTEGLHQLSMRRLTGQAIEYLNTAPEILHELLPQDACDNLPWPDLPSAIQFLHRPPADADVYSLLDNRHPAQRRLAIEELTAHQLSMVRLRAQFRNQQAAPINTPGTLSESFIKSLQFSLTVAQQRVIDEIQKDMSHSSPMLRLVQGDVGSGKTVVALAACLNAVEAGYQAAMMAPTELLAEQHYQNFSEWLEPLGIQLAWLSGKMKSSHRRDTLDSITKNETKIIVGTHALFQDDVQFNNLAMIVIDEQHRFGVHQRLALRNKGGDESIKPHQLIMTATPIPRTLAMTAYADLDSSIIDELPPGRLPINTVAISNKRRAEVIERIDNACKQNRQVYWVCTLIEESETLQCQAAEKTCEELTEALPHLSIGLIHGRMKPEEKRDVMARFSNAYTHLLVATTVIEVGVDVPNASLMVIENAERLGLAQLHQLRGRVGRGNLQSSCVLMYQSPLTKTARQRLDAMRNTADGFEIARIDLQIRGPGEVLGTRQTGMMQFRIADIVRDSDLLPHVQKLTQKIMSDHPAHIEPLIKRWLGESVQYGQV